jgi:PBP1b-binding outer membrane lipoprotein LpoB
MKKTSFLSLLLAITLIIGSCSASQKNAKSKDKPAQEQSQDLNEESFEDTNDDW